MGRCCMLAVGAFRLLRCLFDFTFFIFPLIFSVYGSRVSGCSFLAHQSWFFHHIP